MTRYERQKDLLSLYMFTAEMTFGSLDVSTQQLLADMLRDRYPEMTYQDFKKVWKGMQEDYGQMEELETRFYHALNCVRLRLSAPARSVMINSPCCGSKASVEPMRTRS